MHCEANTWFDVSEECIVSTYTVAEPAQVYAEVTEGWKSVYIRLFEAIW
jgi:hypothetical protein